MIAVVIFIAGLAAVVAGAGLLVFGASRLAVAFGIPPVVIGLTVVGLGASMPGIVVAALASFDGQPATALGTVVGSNVANIGLALGLSVTIFPLVPDRTLLRREGPVLIGLSAAYLLVGLTGTYESWMGFVMLAGLAAYGVAAFRWGRSEAPIVVVQAKHFEERTRLLVRAPTWQSAIFIAVGLALLLAGARGLVTGTVDIADNLDASEFVIAATLLAGGSALPVVITSLVAAFRREADIAIGVIITSSIVNLLGGLGLAALLNPVPVGSDARSIALPWMVGMAIVGVLLARKGYAVGRREGLALLVAYAVYVAWLLLA